MPSREHRARSPSPQHAWPPQFQATAPAAPVLATVLPAPMAVVQATVPPTALPARELPALLAVERPPPPRRRSDHAGWGGAVSSGAGRRPSQPDAGARLWAGSRRSSRTPGSSSLPRCPQTRTMLATQKIAAHVVKRRPWPTTAPHSPRRRAPGCAAGRHRGPSSPAAPMAWRSQPNFRPVLPVFEACGRVCRLQNVHSFLALVF